MKLTKALVLAMEDLDKGKDLRSFKRWSSNFSLRSGASTRRRYAMDSISLQSSRHMETPPSPEGSVVSESASLDEVDGDALLLRLAAHDVVWRKQVVEALRMGIEKMENGEVDDVAHDSEKQNTSIDSALNNALGNFLFGEKMNKLVTKKKQSHALPPEEITTCLLYTSPSPRD